jgi:hypothetical protein
MSQLSVDWFTGREQQIVPDRELCQTKPVLSLQQMPTRMLDPHAEISVGTFMRTWL